MVRLEFLDLSENPIENYTTKSWTFCHGIEYGYGDLMKGIDVFQDFSRDDKFGDDYCLNWVDHHSSRLVLHRDGLGFSSLHKRSERVDSPLWKTKYSNLFLKFFPINRSHLFCYMTKVDMAKDVWILFDIWCGKLFQMKCLPAGYNSVNQLWCQKVGQVKPFSHLQMDIFSHFNF